MLLVLLLGSVLGQDDYIEYNIEEYEGSASADLTECTGTSCDLSVNFPTLAIRLPSNQAKGCNFISRF